MERFAQKELLAWLKSKNRKPLIVWGARQVGKTYLVLELFAKKEFKNSYIYIDFKKEDEIRDFCETTANAKKIIEYISLRFNKQIDKKSLLVFDEIQECPNIISALKYFCQDYPEIPVIATGSMVRIKLLRQSKKRGAAAQSATKNTSSNTQKNSQNNAAAKSNANFLFPVGKINQITLFPMTFAEFLKNDNATLFKAISTAYNEKQPLSPHIHELALNEVYKYLLVGGMPEVVQAYIDNESLVEVRAILKDLYDNYLADMQLYQASTESILKSQTLFENIFAQLNKESKNFSPGLIEKNAKTRDFNSAIQWLSETHIVNFSYQLAEHITCPLGANKQTHFRLYLCDTGMFTYQSGINATSFISAQGTNTLSGIFFENFFANELAANNIPLYYWRGRKSGEIEFIVESNNKLYPIDIKRGKGTLNSLEKFAEHNKFEFAIKVSKNNYGYSSEKKILTLPFYFASFVAEDLAAGNLDQN